jgi:tetratricopeptide (TPR) repeat protein
MFPFPDMNDNHLRSIDYSFLDYHQISLYLERLEILLDERLPFSTEKDFTHNHTFCHFLLLKGYMLLREEKFDEAKTLSAQCYNLSKELGLYDFAVSSLELSGRIETIRHAPEKALSFFKSMYEEASSYNNLVKQGVALRLMGLQYLFSGNYDLSRINLSESLNIFEQLRSMSTPYSLCEAAANDILGELHLYQGDFVSASESFRKALSIVSKANIFKGQESFFSGLGHSLYNMGNLEEAKLALEKSINLLSNFISGQVKYRGWYRGIVISNGFMSLISAHEMNYRDCFAYLERAIRFAEKSQRIDLLGVIERIKAELARFKEKDPYMEKLLSDLIPNTAEYYKQKAIQMLEATSNIGEKNIVENI